MANDSNESILYKKLSTERYTDLDSFNCPVCLNMVVPPIRMVCSNHHSVCNGCLPHLRSKMCPVCRLPHTHSINRCYEAERILQKLLANNKNSCRYSQYGCNILIEDDLQTHEKTCPYRIVKKTSDLCSWWVAFHTRFLMETWRIPAPAT